MAPVNYEGWDRGGLHGAGAIDTRARGHQEFQPDLLVLDITMLTPTASALKTIRESDRYTPRCVPDRARFADGPRTGAPHSGRRRLPDRFRLEWNPVARVAGPTAPLGRPATAADDETLRVGDLVLDGASREVTRCEPDRT